MPFPSPNLSGPGLAPTHPDSNERVQTQDKKANWFADWVELQSLKTSIVPSASHNFKRRSTCCCWWRAVSFVFTFDLQSHNQSPLPTTGNKDVNQTQS